jgi:hypothetical protein
MTDPINCKPRISLAFRPAARAVSQIVVAAVALFNDGGSAFADEPSASRADDAILITFDPSAGEYGSIVGAMQAHLRGLPVRVVIKPMARARSLGQKLVTSAELATSSRALGAFSLEIADDRACLIFFTEPDGNSTLIRRLPPNEQGLRVTIEEAAIVVRSLVLALLEGRRVGMTTETESHPEDVTPPVFEATPEKNAAGASPSHDGSADAQDPPASVKRDVERETEENREDDEPKAGDAGRDARRRTLAASAAYAGTDFGNNSAWQSGLTLGVRWLALAQLYGAARYTIFPELEGKASETTVSIARHPAEIVIGYRTPALLALNAEASLMLDPIQRHTSRNAPGYEPAPASSRFTVAVGGRGGASWSLVPALELAFRGGADILLSSYAYSLPDGDTVISPHRIRPRVDFELSANLW